MKPIQIAFLCLLAVACGGQNAKYEIKKVEVQPEMNTLKESDAVNLLDKGEDAESVAGIIRRTHTPNFSWTKFWNGLREEEIFNKLSNSSLSSILELGEMSCQSSDIRSFSGLILNQKAMTEETKQILTIESLLKVYEACSKLSSLEDNKILLQQIKVLLVDSSTQKKKLLLLLEKTIHLQKSKLDSQAFYEVAEILSNKDWSELTIAVKNEHSSEMISQLILIVRMVKPNSESSVKSLLLDILKKQTSMEEVLNLFGKTDTLKLLSSYGELVYGENTERDILKDIKTIALNKVEKNNYELKDIEQEWKDLTLLKKLLNTVLKKEEFPQSMRLFNTAVKALEKSISKSNGAGQKFISFESDSDLLAKWIAVRVLNAKNGRYIRPSVQMDQFIFEEGTVEDILRARLALYSAAPEARKQLQNDYCQTLAQYGFENKMILDINEVRNLSANKTNGCVVFDSGKLSQIDLKQDAIVFDDDLHLTLKNTTVSFEAKKVDLNFLDLSSTILHADAKPDASPRDLNAIVIPLVLGLKHKFDFESEKIHYFLYYYKKQDASPGVPFYAWEPKTGHAGGNLTIKLASKGESFFPSFTSEGGLGQKAQGPRNGGKGVEYSDSFGDSLAKLPELKAGKFLNDANKIRAILNANDTSIANISVIDYLPKMGVEFSNEISTIERCVNDLKTEILPQAIGAKKLFEKIANEAVTQLKIDLMINGDQNMMPNFFDLEDASAGPMPVDGQVGEEGMMSIMVN